MDAFLSTPILDHETLGVDARWGTTSTTQNQRVCMYEYWDVCDKVCVCVSVCLCIDVVYLQIALCNWLGFWRGCSAQCGRQRSRQLRHKVLSVQPVFTSHTVHILHPQTSIFREWVQYASFTYRSSWMRRAKSLVMKPPSTVSMTTRSRVSQKEANSYGNHWNLSSMNWSHQHRIRHCHTVLLSSLARWARPRVQAKILQNDRAAFNKKRKPYIQEAKHTHTHTRTHTHKDTYSTTITRPWSIRCNWIRACLFTLLVATIVPSHGSCNICTAMGRHNTQAMLVLKANGALRWWWLVVPWAASASTVFPSGQIKTDVMRPKEPKPWATISDSTSPS